MAWTAINGPEVDQTNVMLQILIGLNSSICHMQASMSTGSNALIHSLISTSAGSCFVLTLSWTFHMHSLSYSNFWSPALLCGGKTKTTWFKCKLWIFANEVWQSDFEHLLRIRFSTHHSKCTLCLKHRLLIKKLGHCPAARRAQHAMLQKHLQRQQKDRQVYYAARARSRLGATMLGEIEVTAILDSMDAQKHAWPRSRSMACKEFASFNRPRLTSTTLLVHGHMVLVALSPSLVTCGSSRTAEIICAGLSRMAAKLDFRSVWVNLQADNASKEVKNVGILRLMAMWTGLHKIAGAEISFLSSGHSHEDVDALFSLLRAHLEKKPRTVDPRWLQDLPWVFFRMPWKPSQWATAVCWNAFSVQGLDSHLTSCPQKPLKPPEW